MCKTLQLLNQKFLQKHFEEGEKNSFCKKNRFTQPNFFSLFSILFLLSELQHHVFSMLKQLAFCIADVMPKLASVAQKNNIRFFAVVYMQIFVFTLTQTISLLVQLKKSY